MGDLPLFRRSKVINTTFSRADGLTPGSYIYVNGVKVGSAKSLTLSDENDVDVKMTFNLGDKIPNDSEAHLQSSALLEDKVIVIERGDSSKYLSDGDSISGAYDMGRLET